jgi:hypothetical protein
MGLIMELYRSYSGMSNPNFLYKVALQQVTAEMYEWCDNYDDKDNRYYANWKEFQFENEQTAILFGLKFA